MNSIFVIGSLNMDLTIHAPRQPIMGETLTGGGFMVSPGGKGANQAVAAARLGGDVSILGCVGDDLFGRDLVASLQKSSVSTKYIKTVGNAATGVAVITVVDGDNCIILEPGANALIKAEHILEAEDMIKEADILLLQMEIPMQMVARAIDTAGRYGTKVLLNPAPACELPEGLLPRVDIITPNESECSTITGVEVNTVEDAKKAARYLISGGVRQVVVTLGENGAVYNRGGQIVHKSVPRVKAVDTTAAGDSFSGALAVALSNGKSIDDAVEFASLVGTITVTRKGAQSSLPTIDEVKNMRL